MLGVFCEQDCLPINCLAELMRIVRTFGDNSRVRNGVTVKLQEPLQLRRDAFVEVKGQAMLASRRVSSAWRCCS